MQSCELLFDDSMGPAMKAEGEKSLRTAIATLEAKVRFLRFALGSQAINDGFAQIAEAKDLFAKLFAVNSKTQLEWDVETPKITNRQMRLLMNMTLIMVDPAAKGTCKVSAREAGGQLELAVTAIGPYAQIKAEVQDGLVGKEPQGGWGGGAIQPYFTRLLAEEMGFTLNSSVEQGRSILAATGILSEG
jgi:hypothetical protein